MRIKEVKFKDGFHIIKYMKNADEFSIKSVEMAMPVFYTSMKALKKYFVEICEFDTNYSQSISVMGLAVIYDNDGDIIKVQIAGAKILKNRDAFLEIKSPKFAPGSSESDVVQLLEHAKQYIAGERQQGNLFDDEQKEQEVPPPPEAIPDIPSLEDDGGMELLNGVEEDKEITEEEVVNEFGRES